MSSDFFGPWTYPAVFSLAYMVYLFSDRLLLLQQVAAKISRRTEGEGHSGESFDDPIQEWTIYLQKFLGFLLLGPFLIFYASLQNPHQQLGLGLPQILVPGLSGISIIVLPIVIILGISFLRSPKKIDWSYYPQVRRSIWTPKRLSLNTVVWILYLWGYEFAFRGFLFFPFVDLYGVSMTIALNSALYSLAHLFKGPGESFGAFFLGILFCILAYYTSSFFLPFLLHSILALGNDFLAIKAHPTMRFSNGK